MHPISNKCGIGLRSEHYQEVITTLPQIDLLEIHSENFFSSNRKLDQVLETISANYHISFHCVGMSLGSTDKINKEHLNRLKELVDIHKPYFISDHLAWSSVEGVYLHDLLPLPYTLQSLELFKDKVKYAQDYLGHQILIENPSLYISFPESTISETDFLNDLAANTGCGILLDINNIYISSHNLSYNPRAYIDNIDASVVKQVHLAGFVQGISNILIDTHSTSPAREVLELFKYFIHKNGVRPIIFEQDQNLGTLSSLLNEAREIDKIIVERTN